MTNKSAEIMRVVRGCKLAFVFMPLLCAAGGSPLYERGYTVLPEPQKVTLGADDFRFGPGWRLELGPGVPANDTAIAALKEDLEARFRLKLAANGQEGVVRLSISAPGVAIGAAQDHEVKAIAEQAYRIDLKARSVNITANASAGLFYGVETLVQLPRCV